MCVEEFEFVYCVVYCVYCVCVDVFGSGISSSRDLLIKKENIYLSLSNQFKDLDF